MKKKVLFSIPLFRGTKKQKKFIYNNFRQALQGIIDENLFFVEHFADINFYIDGCEKVKKLEIKRIYLADVKPYDELWYRAVNDKWLKVPDDFMYDKEKYKNQKFLFSKRARKISEFYKGEMVILTEKYIQALNGEYQIELKEQEKIANEFFPIQQDVECYVSNDGLDFKAISPNKDINSVRAFIQNQPESFMALNLDVVDFKFDGKVKCLKSINVYAKEDKITVSKALKKSKNSSHIRMAVEKGEKNFIYNAQIGCVLPAPNAVFVPRNTILNEWKF